MRYLTLSIALLLLAAAPAAAQEIPAVGGGATLDVATWNIEWFGSTFNGPADEELQLQNVRLVMERSGIDLWGVQEIAHPDHFARLLTALGPRFAGRLADQGGQRIGFVYDTETVRFRQARHILTHESTDFAGRPPLLLEANVVLPDTQLAVTFVVVHMKAFGDQRSYELRQGAAAALKEYLDLLYPSQPVVALGDFNDELGGSIFTGHPSPYLPFLEDSTDYRFLTLPLDRAGANSYCNDASCSSGSLLDHILVTDELAPHAPAPAAVYTELPRRIPGYASTTSDHLPVFARFAFPASTGAGASPAATAARMDGVFPNPFRDEATLEYELPAAARVRLELFDLTGRRVAVLADGHRPAGAHAARLEAADLPPGVYVARLSVPGAVLTRRLVKLR